MTDAETLTESTKPSLDSKAYLDQLEQAVKRAKEIVKSAEAVGKKAGDVEIKLDDILAKVTEAQAKADNEALRAYQAKEIVEQHSNATAKLKGTSEADAASIAKNLQESTAAVQNLVNLRQGSESDATSIGNSRKSADEAAKAVSETLGKASSMVTSLAETKKNVEAMAQAVREETKSLEADLSEITSTKEKSANLLAAMQKENTAAGELYERAKTIQSSVEGMEKTAKTKMESVKELVKQSQELEQRVKSYEGNLAHLHEEFAATKAKIEGLLPGATSAGLASAFSTQRQHFKAEREKWAMILVGSIGCLMLVVIILGWHSFGSGPQEWRMIARLFLQRLPYMLPPIWLAIYAGRQHMLATQMEAEYAHKETASTSFEGYKREMESNPEGAKTLCADALAIIARRPGLVYEGKQQDVTPLNVVVETMEKLVPTIMEATVKSIKGQVLPPST